MCHTSRYKHKVQDIPRLSDYPLKSLKHGTAAWWHRWRHGSTWPTFPHSPWRRWHHGRGRTRRGWRRDRRFAHDVGGWTSGPSGCAMDVTGTEHWRKVTPLTAERTHRSGQRKTMDLPKALPKALQSPEGPRKMPRIP
jgi:hypothetical protein